MEKVGKEKKTEILYARGGRRGRARSAAGGSVPETQVRVFFLVARNERCGSARPALAVRGSTSDLSCSCIPRRPERPGEKNARFVGWRPLPDSQPTRASRETLERNRRTTRFYRAASKTRRVHTRSGAPRDTMREGALERASTLGGLGGRAHPGAATTPRRIHGDIVNARRRAWARARMW